MFGYIFRADPTEDSNEVTNIKGTHARFKLLEELYKDHLHVALDAKGEDFQVKYHR